MGSEGGGSDLNLGTPDPVRSAIRSDSPPWWLTCLAVAVVLGSSSVPEANRSEKEVVMNGCVEKVNGCEFAEVSKLPEEEAI